jgi:hypothetical protein
MSASTRNETRLVTDIAKMIGHETYNYAPVNYTIAEKAIEIIQRRRVRPLKKALREISTLAKAWDDPHVGDEIIAIIDGLK